MWSGLSVLINLVIKQKEAWNHDESALVDLKSWKNKDKLESHLDSVHKEAAVGDRKGMKKCINRFKMLKKSFFLLRVVVLY